MASVRVGLKIRDFYEISAAPYHNHNNHGSKHLQGKVTFEETVGFLNMATKKVSSAGRFGVRYGKRIREAVVMIEKRQKQKQICPYCKKPAAKRMAKGIWECRKCNKKFTGGAYFLG